MLPLKSRVELAVHDVFETLNAAICAEHQAHKLTLPDEEFRRLIARYLFAAPGRTRHDHGSQTKETATTTNRIPVREAGKQISVILASGKTVSIGHRYGTVRGFIVAVPAHNEWDDKERKKALREAKLAFQKKTWTEECSR
jgi:hypothetical protein